MSRTALNSCGAQSRSRGVGAPAVQGRTRTQKAPQWQKPPVIKLRVKTSKGAKVCSAGQHLLDSHVQPWLCWLAATPLQAKTRRSHKHSFAWLLQRNGRSRRAAPRMMEAALSI
jgi:hypothetical protein